MRIAVVTIFPALVEGVLTQSILGRAARDEAVHYEVIDVRRFADDPRRSVDDTPFGGGAGMVLKPEPFAAALRVADAPHPWIGMSPAGRRFTQREAERLADLDAFTLVCGRYEGFDARLEDSVFDELLSVGDVVLQGGELAALLVIEAVVRLVPHVLGNTASAVEESFGAEGLLEYPQYTRPRSFEGLEVPPVLLSGDHQEVARWRRAAALARTLRHRPDLIVARGGLADEEVSLLERYGYADLVARWVKEQEGRR
ncbi:tRNA (guanine-N1)-methyltransferase [Acidimicrobium ferrooxidans DSM 10331]|uniref:tRNA (guanine-N(1)-)-methyltransferase n=1 Tax=Acidimicrobium ferrooxidans (strain DSM 10331 / JCM 15462 / NBRC 103882 / ICP) TaxID=525909 RepID=C7M0B3_ACIFD|nr:tRNA (guanosine(37)-N1)-methyltransferase TrmD [Acidimicrobium ferrooxidans]ACU54421.1 tRNA (guanine-N1)-methyltransferase [Acidimicrobium ferrooxidans DSM 10331]